MKSVDFAAINLAPFEGLVAITNKPARRSNPIPTKPEEDEEETRPGKEDPKRKKKKQAYEVTC